MDLKKIDLNKLQDYAFTPNELVMEPMVSRHKFIGIGCLENESIVPTVQAIPLDKVKQAREEMTAYIEPTTGQWTSGFNNGVNTCIEILDKLIAEN